MAYMLLIMEPVGQRRERSEAEGRELYARMLRFGEDLKARGLLVASESLRPAAEGIRVQLREGKRTLVDGPFSEAKEMVGGFFLLACATRAKASSAFARSGWGRNSRRFDQLPHRRMQCSNPSPSPSSFCSRRS